MDDDWGYPHDETETSILSQLLEKLGNHYASKLASVFVLSIWKMITISGKPNKLRHDAPVLRSHQNGVRLKSIGTCARSGRML